MVIDRSARSFRLALLVGIVGVALFAVGGNGPATATPTTTGAQPTIVLVHGDWADASSTWAEVAERLQNKGFTVAAPPNPLRGPATDAPYFAAFLHSISGPIVLVAHSYGGFVATNAATGNPNVKALVYIDAFMPDEGETGNALIADSGSCIVEHGLNPVPFDGGLDLYLRWDADPPSYPGFADCFANGVEEREARVLAAAQRPAALAQFSEPSGPPAWKTIPSWSLIGTQDHVIPPALLERMSGRAAAHITSVRAGHLTPITRPGDVTKLILSAVDATS